MSAVPFIWPIRVYYEDTDAGGVMYYANYLKFMERARTEWLRNLGFGQSALSEQHGILFVVRTVELKYLRPARLDDALEILTDVESRGRASLTFKQVAVPATDRQQILCSGRIAIACVRVGSFRPTAIPDALVEEISRAT